MGHPRGQREVASKSVYSCSIPNHGSSQDTSGRVKTAFAAARVLLGMGLPLGS